MGHKKCCTEEMSALSRKALWVRVAGNWATTSCRRLSSILNGWSINEQCDEGQTLQLEKLRYQHQSKRLWNIVNDAVKMNSQALAFALTVVRSFCPDSSSRSYRQLNDVFQIELGFNPIVAAEVFVHQQFDSDHRGLGKDSQELLQQNPIL